MTFQLEESVRDLFRSPRRPKYGVSVVWVEPDLSVIDVVFRFLPDRSYCCSEPSCHLPQGCGRLILAAKARGIILPEDVIVRWHGYVEKGAHFQMGNFLTEKALAFEFISDRRGSEKKAAALARATSVRERLKDFTGIWTDEQPGGVKVEIEYVNGVKNGFYRSWLGNGVCHREGFKKDGHWHGCLTTRKSDGTVLDESTFFEGTGVYRIFNSNGQLTDEIPQRHGRAHGAARRWVGGRQVEIRHYIEGECMAVNFDG